MALAGLMSVALFSSRADARSDEVRDQVVMIDKVPPRLKTRLKGTGIRSRTLATVGARHRVHVATLQMRLAPALAVRGGAGVSKLRPYGLLSDTRAPVVAAGASLTLWQGENVQLDIDLNATRAYYADGVLDDTTVLLALRNR